MSLREAIEKAEEAGVDLVEISLTPNRQFVVSWTTASSFMKRASLLRNRRKKAKVIQVKEIKFRPGTDDGDYQVKLTSLVRFLEEGDKAKITLRFRGREMAHQQNPGWKCLPASVTIWSELAVVESFPTKIEGRQMIMVLALRRNSKAFK